MNAQVLDEARAAYRSGDFARAVQLFDAVKGASEVAGEVDHLRGNALMRLGRYAEAAEAYSAALADEAYGKRGALLTNRGKAYAAVGDAERAVSSFTEATQDPTYATPYKAYLGLGQELMGLDRVAEAGTAYRQAAIDGANPAPAGALAQLGVCFVKLGRPGDAVESYRTALDFAGPRDDTRAINAGLAQAYVAAQRYAEAVETFKAATSDGIYQLTPEQQNDLASAQDALAAASAQNAISATAPGAPSLDDKVDPLDPLGKSGSFMPDPSDTGFFTLSESEMVQQDKRQMKVRRRHRHVGLKIFLVLLVLVIIAAGVCVFGYTRGYGIPSQQDALTGLFQAVTDGGDTDQYLASALSDDAKAVLVSSIPSGATPTIEAMDQSMTESEAQVAVQLSLGATQTYDVTFVRSDNHIGWVVSGLSIDFSSSDESSTDTSGTSSTSSVDDSSTSDTSSTAGSDEDATLSGTTGSSDDTDTSTTTE